MPRVQKARRVASKAAALEKRCWQWLRWLSTSEHGASPLSPSRSSCVIADLVDVVRALTTDPGNRVPHLAFQADQVTAVPIAPIEDVVSAHYLRMRLYCYWMRRPVHWMQKANT